MRLLDRERTVKSVVLFGSNAREFSKTGHWSDFDLHVVTSAPGRLERMDWASVDPKSQVCWTALRAAAAGVRKLTVVFSSGQIDMVIVPLARSKRVRRTFLRDVSALNSPETNALNEMATCLWAGYRFLKGEAEWGQFYSRVVKEMPGVRLGDVAIEQLANLFVCDLLWILQKLERGELLAAQHALHRQLSEVNLRLMRELRLREGKSLPSFGLGRRFEQLLSASDLKHVRVDARSDRKSLQRAAWNLYAGLCSLMTKLRPSWSVPKPMISLIGQFSPTSVR